MSAFCKGAFFMSYFVQRPLRCWSISYFSFMQLPNSEELTKRYYSIGEVAALFEVNASLIRFWEKEFSQLHPKKNQRGKRMFTPKDIDMFKVIFHLVKEQGYTIEGAKRRLKENKEETMNVAAIAGRLGRIKEELIKIKDNL